MIYAKIGINYAKTFTGLGTEPSYKIFLGINYDQISVYLLKWFRTYTKIGINYAEIVLQDWAHHLVP